MSSFDGRAYQERIDRLAAGGMDVHGEADLVAGFAPRSVLDAGCGTGRVAAELARRGIDVVGVDVNRSMLAEARRRAGHLEWILADLAEMDLGRSFDVVLMAGNVPLFCPPQSRAAVVTRCAAHVGASGRLVAGFQLGRDYPISDYDDACAAAGLALEARWASWERDPWQPGGEYSVSVHRRFTDAEPGNR